MTESHNTPGVLTLVAIDIAKGREVLVQPPAPAKRRRFQMADTGAPSSITRAFLNAGVMEDGLAEATYEGPRKEAH